MNIICLVLDSFGIGNAPDADKYGDKGSNTYNAISQSIKIPNLAKLGLNNIDSIDFAASEKNPIACYGRLIEKSCGKDTTTGHFEMMGIITQKPNPTYPNGFPKEIIERLQKAWGVSVIGNVAASGTQIINELGDEHRLTKSPIIYTSADSVLQIACDEDIYSVDRLYAMCQSARKIMSGQHKVARVIARPFKKAEDGSYYRTASRRDFGLSPQGESVLNKLTSNNIKTIGIGKISDIFCGCGIAQSVEAHGNQEVIDNTLQQMALNSNSFIFSNLVDFDMKYGHRNDVDGYRKCLEHFDDNLPKFLSSLSTNDILIITADHGCDPSTPSTDHSRECVPLLIYSHMIKPKNLGTILGFDYIGEYILKMFKI